MGIPTSSWACTTNSWAAPAQRTGADLPATLVCWQLGILHQQLGLLGRLPAGLALERPVWSCNVLDTWLLLRLRSCTRTALAQGWTDGRAGRAGRTRQQRRVLDYPRADFRVKSLPMGRYPLTSRSRMRWCLWRRRAVSGMGCKTHGRFGNGVKAMSINFTWGRVVYSIYITHPGGFPDGAHPAPPQMESTSTHDHRVSWGATPSTTP